MDMKEKARLSVAEALDKLHNKSPRSTLTERWFLLEEARALYEHLPQPLCMGHGLNYVLEHASLPIEPHDLLLGRFIDKIPTDEEEARFLAIDHDGHYVNNPITCHTGGHFTIDAEALLALGMSGYQEKAERRLEELRANGAPAESVCILEGLVLSYRALRTYIRRYGEAAREAGRDDMADVCASLADHAPKTFREALQLILFVNVLYYVYMSNPITCMTLGRVDELLLPYYEADLASGILTREEAGCLIDDFYAKTNLTLGRGEHQMSNVDSNKNNTGWARNPCYDSPTYILLGGESTTRDSHTENTLSLLFLEHIQPAFKHPVVVYRWSKNCPDTHWHVLCEKLREGASILTYNDETMIPALLNNGVDKADAAEYSIHACNWPDIHGGFASAGDIGGPIPKWIMYALMKDGKPRQNYQSIDELYGVLEEFYRAQTRAKFAEYRKRFRSGEERPVWCGLSGNDCFTAGVIENARHWGDGAVKYPCVHNMVRNIGTAADMMAALEEVVFTKKQATLEEMCDALVKNFEGYTPLLALCRKAPKYGTDDEIADGHACRLMNMILDVVDEEAVNENGVRDVYVVSVTITDMNHIGEGAHLMATPDGRLAGAPLSENLSPTVGVNDSVTALLKSVSKLPADRLHSGAFNLRLQKSLVRGDDGLERLKILLKTYFLNGGMQFQLSIADTDELRKAQQCPGEYCDLLVRITGYSAIFVDMAESAQNEIIRREELHG